ncbi:unnamed protein product [Orchesella dallaii]|uniref:Protein kinase domain-containing protein n=1 Tax=Orchesella dallaii TaxID=48710 RepID=A0ABP1S8Q0_9HEXA
MASTAILHQLHHHHGAFSKSLGITHPSSSSINNVRSGSDAGGTGNDSSDTQGNTQSQSRPVSGKDVNPQETGKPKSNNRSGAVLARKYLLSFEGTTQCPPKNVDPNTPLLQPTKTPLLCMKLDTREPLLCRIYQRDDRGVNVLAAHERLGECSEFINPVTELIVSPKYFYLISPPNYGNLHSYIHSKTALKETRARHLFQQMVSIVKFCHAKGIILRDLKMGRFVFTDKERTTIKLDSLEDVVVLPKPDSDDDSLDDRHGCPNYVSPEKAGSVMQNGIRYPGKASDIWSLGISLYAMLAGRYPFNDNDCSRLLHKIRNGSYSMVEGISPFAKSLVRCLLTKNPGDRPSCRELLNHPWFKAEELKVTPIRSREEPESDTFRAKRMRLNDDQVVPGS